MSRKRRKITSIGTISSRQQFEWAKPKYNGFAIGNGKHGDTKYNRKKAKLETKRIIQQAHYDE